MRISLATEAQSDLHLCRHFPELEKFRFDLVVAAVGIRAEMILCLDDSSAFLRASAFALLAFFRI